MMGWVSSQSSVLVSNSDLTRSRQPYNQGRYPLQMRNAGWALFARQGTWGFNIGDGHRNYHYQPHEGTQPINDGELQTFVKRALDLAGGF